MTLVTTSLGAYGVVVNSKSMLIVDDSPVICESIEEMIRIQGPQCPEIAIDRAHNVNDAISALTLHRYQVLVVDYKLPDGIGCSVVRVANAATSPRLVCAMSADDSSHVREEMLAAGADHFYSKAELAHLVGSVCEYLTALFRSHGA